MAVRHIIFDCDGVLVDSESLAAVIQSEMFTGLGADVPADVIRTRFVGHTAKELWLTLAAEKGIDLPPDFLAIRKRVLMEEFGKRLEVVPGVPQTLPRFSQLLSVASNSEGGMLLHKLTVTGIIEFFGDRIFSIDHVERPKPAPDLYLAALKRGGVPAGETIVVEDTPVGIAAARAAGLNAIGFTGASHVTPDTPRELKEAGAVAVLDDFRGLPDFIAASGI
jgi:HAD superfamily hydrolase (TIGR01509 family)